MSGGWWQRARCTEVDGDLWFPEKGKPTALARRICAGCEVRPQCLAWALAQPGELDGVWGGTTVMERRDMRRGAAA